MVSEVESKCFDELLVEFSDASWEGGPRAEHAAKHKDVGEVTGRRTPVKLSNQRQIHDRQSDVQGDRCDNKYTDDSVFDAVYLGRNLVVELKAFSSQYCQDFRKANLRVQNISI